MICTTMVNSAYAKGVTSIETALKVLAKATTVSSSQAGEMANHPETILAFNFIYHSATPQEHFITLYKNGNTVGKFYALIGLYMLEDIEYKAYYNKFMLTPQQQVDVQPQPSPYPFQHKFLYVFLI